MTAAGHPRGEQGAAARSAARGFTLLEVMVAVAILALSLTSLLSAQMEAMRATRYARGVSVAAFLADAKLLEIEAQSRIDGWGSADKNIDGDFGDDGWPDISYECLIDYIELPDFNALQQAQQASDSGDEGDGGFGTSMIADAADQSVAGMGMVWPIIKGAVEQAIRKAWCRVKWHDGALEHEFVAETFWTDVRALTQIPQTGETTEADDSSEADAGGAGSSNAGGPGTAGAGRTAGKGAAGGASARPGLSPAGPTGPAGGRR